MGVGVLEDTGFSLAFFLEPLGKDIFLACLK